MRLRVWQVVSVTVAGVCVCSRWACICEEWSYYSFVKYCWSAELWQSHTRSYLLPFQNKCISLNCLERGFAFQFPPSLTLQWVDKDSSTPTTLKVSRPLFLFWDGLPVNGQSFQGSEARLQHGETYPGPMLLGGLGSGEDGDGVAYSSEGVSRKN